MATLRVRYRNGETDEWEIHERMKGLDVAKALWVGMDRESVNFAVADRSGGGPADYGRVTLRMSEVAMWHLDGLIDFPSDVGVWTEQQDPPSESDPGT
jgi:hypothetical protein